MRKREGEERGGGAPFPLILGYTQAICTCIHTCAPMCIYVELQITECFVQKLNQLSSGKQRGFWGIKMLRPTQSWAFANTHSGQVVPGKVLKGSRPARGV